MPSVWLTRSLSQSETDAKSRSIVEWQGVYGELMEVDGMKANVMESDGHIRKKRLALGQVTQVTCTRETLNSENLY
jgi:hypothetical protein